MKVCVQWLCGFLHPRDNRSICWLAKKNEHFKSTQSVQSFDRRQKKNGPRKIEEPKKCYTLWTVWTVCTLFAVVFLICYAYKVLIFFICLVSFALLTHSNNSMNTYGCWAQANNSQCIEPTLTTRHERTRQNEDRERCWIQNVCDTIRWNALHTRLAITQAALNMRMNGSLCIQIIIKRIERENK